MDEKHVKTAPMYAFKNREAVERSQVCGCYNCLETVQVNEIEFWTDDDETALCPRCTLDTLIADHFEVPLDKESLQVLRNHWLVKKP